ncbi:MAG TPA: NAD(P)/FAD-dependent oxidoreductase [Puia sp.]|nr:NAD(P)/FAD-dependent oxidoreductase [Puia sp.]
MKNQYDVAIAGGGPAGTMAANELARLGKKVILLEASDYRRLRIGETLTPPVNNLLKKQGLWDGFLNEGHLPSWGNRSAWGSQEIESSSYIFSPYGNGWHLDRSRFDKFLFEAAKKSGALCLLNQKVTHLNFNGQFLVEIKNQEDICEFISARFFIDATGRSGNLSLGMGGQRVKDNHLLAHVAQYDDPGPQNFGMLVETVPDGWWYSAPIPGDKHIVIFFTDAEGSRRLSRRGWETCLYQAPHTQTITSNLSIKGTRRIVSAGSHLLIKKDWGIPWLACGDAIMAVDPLSSSGIQHAMESGICAASATAAWLKGDPSVAMEYEKKSCEDYTQYLGLRVNYYSLEKRWSESGFWSKQKHSSPMEAKIPLNHSSF